MIVLILSNRCGMVGVGLGELRFLRKGVQENMILLAVQITIELVVFFGIRTGTSSSKMGYNLKTGQLAEAEWALIGYDSCALD
jgi:uncharacterized membrane protein